ncbi:MAG: RagB/SusD family nutrient uptake outer membrane protein [Parabacteroides sp.]
MGYMNRYTEANSHLTLRYWKHVRDNVYGKGSLATISEYKGFSTANITNMGHVWTALYLSIRNANVVIKNTTGGNKISEDKKAQFIGEAKFLRAFDYFALVRLWAGVPLRTEETMDMIEVARSSMEDVYELIVSDLEYAEEYLPDTLVYWGHLLNGRQKHYWLMFT